MATPMDIAVCTIESATIRGDGLLSVVVAVRSLLSIVYILETSYKKNHFFFIIYLMKNKLFK